MFDPLLKFETLILGRSKIARNVRIFPRFIVPERKIGFFVKIKSNAQNQKFPLFYHTTSTAEVMRIY
jgi:hypothetical protein